MLEHKPSEILWNPDAELIEKSNLTAFFRNHDLADYDALLEKSTADPEWFWNAIIKDFDLRFYEPYSKVLDTSKGIEWAEWCLNGKTNAVLNCIDRYRDTPTWDKPAVIWEGESGKKVTWNYAKLHKETSRIAGALRELGVGKGDVVALYLPMIPEAAAAMMAILKVGAIFMPLFSGFGADAIAMRLNDADAVAVITVNGATRRSKPSPMKAVVDEAAKSSPSLRHILVHRFVDIDVEWQEDRDHWLDEICARQPDDAPTEVMNAEDQMMLLYTSGTTGKPKGTVHTHCGFPAKIASDLMLCMDLKPEDRFMWMSDLGWVVGPLLVIGSTLAGATMVMAEGAPDYPDKGRMWRIVEENKVSYLGVAPTTIRSFIRAGGGGIETYDLSSIRATVGSGEPWTPDAWLWFMENACKNKAPILNISGGTEIGCGIIVSTVIHPAKPGSFTGPLPAMGADIVDDTGQSIQDGEVGELVLRMPSIGLTRSLWRSPERYTESYWSTFPGIWHHGDWALKDKDGFWFLLGRSDDTLKLAGKRTGPSEIEMLLSGTGKIAESAAIGVPDPVKGEVVVCVCTPLDGVEPTPELKQKLSEAVVSGLGVPYRPREIVFVKDLPKTRNMKVMRRVVKAAYLGKPAGDLSSLVNPEAVEALVELVHGT